MKDEHENTRRPEGETRPRPPEGETRTEEEYRGLTRSLAQDVGTLALSGTVLGITHTTGRLAAEGVAAKVKDVLTQKDEPSKIELPPRRRER